MKNIINKFVIIVLIFAFIMPEFVMARANTTTLFSNAREKYKQETVNKNTRATLPATKQTINTDEKTNITVNDATTSNNKKEYKLSEERIVKLNSLIKNVNTAKEDIVTMCGGISNDLSKIKGLGITASITSGIGTGLAASALAAGMKRKEKIEEREKREKKQKEERLRKLDEEKRKQEELEKKKKEEEKKQDENKDGEKEEEKKDDEKKELVEDKEKEDEVVEENGKDDDKKEEKKKKEQEEARKKAEEEEYKKFRNKKIREKLRKEFYDVENWYQVVSWEELFTELQNKGKIEKGKEYDKKLIDDFEKNNSNEYNKILDELWANKGFEEWKIDLYQEFSKQKEFIINNFNIDTAQSVLKGIGIGNLIIFEYNGHTINKPRSWFLDGVDEAWNKEKSKKKVLLTPKPLQDKYINNFSFETYFAVLTPEQKLGHTRTGLMAGASLTSAVSMGTSAGGSVGAGKLYEKMTACNKAVANLKKVKSILQNEIWGIEMELKSNDVYDTDIYLKVANETNKTAKTIVKGCKKYDTKDIVTVKNILIGSSVISGIGTATAIAGTATSVMANTKNTTGTEKGKKLDMASNIMAGITTGTSATTMVLSATAAAKLGEKLIEQATTCEAILD